jgi:type VI secretion system secreted protein Hcp
LKRKQAGGWIVVGVLALLLLIPAQAKAAYEFYVTIDGERQGRFKGESMRKGMEGKIPGVRFQYSAHIPRDPQSGLASGKRLHQPVVITKQWGTSSPQIFLALTTGEHLKSVVIEFVRTNPGGKEYIFQIIRLSDAVVASFRQYANVANPGEPAYPLGLEDFSFTFKKIEIINTDAKTQAMDDWAVPR